MPSFLYTLIIFPLYTLIECVYVFFEKVTDNTGVSIIGVSLGITLLCLPLYAVAERWQQVERNKRKSMEGQLERIRRTFSGDERYMMTGAYYRECRYSQLMALRSSLGLLVQIPFFIAAYSFLSQLKTTSSFLFIRNLGASDALFSIGGFQVNVLPLLMTLVNAAASAVYTRGFRLREKLPVYAMALVFLCVLYPSPSALVLYWTMNNVFSLVKNVLYKLPNPRRSFYRLCRVLLVPAALFVLARARTNTANKLIFLLLVALAYAAPPARLAAERLIKRPLARLAGNARARHAVFFSSSLVLLVLTGLAVPSTLIASSPTEFADIGSASSPLLYVANTFVQAAGIFAFWGPCVYFLFGRKAQTAIAAALCALALCALVNVYVFALSYGDISNALKFIGSDDFSGGAAVALANVAALALVCALVPPLLSRPGAAAAVLSVLLLAVTALAAKSAAEIHVANAEYREHFAGGEAEDIEPIVTLSKDKPNVVLLYLDMAQGQFIEEMAKEDPELPQVFEGFTFFDNALSFNGHTIMGSPGVYGGYEYTPLEMNRRDDVPLVEKHNESLVLLPRIFSETLGFDAVMTDPSWPNYRQFCDLSFLAAYPLIRGYKTCGTYYSLWSREYKELSGNDIPDNSGDILKRNLIFFSLFRESPTVLRKLVYKNGTYWSSSSRAENGKAALDNYSALYYLPRLTRVAETGRGSYMAFVNQLTHENDTMLFEAPGYVPVAEVRDFGTSAFRMNNAYHTQMAAFKLIGRWLAHLKENGVYDNTRIVIASDHGGSSRESRFEKDDALDNAVTGGQYRGRGHYHCLLMYKDFGARGAMALDRKTFMTNADVPSLLLRGFAEGGAANPFTGKPIPDDTGPLKEGGVLISASDAHQPGNNGTFTFSIKESEWWRVRDDIFKSENWRQGEK